MANYQFDIKGDLDDLIADLNAMDVDRLAPMMLEEAAPILEQEIKSRASAHRDTGDMVRSIKPTKVKNNDSGYYISVRPTGKDKKGVRNMEKMAYLEFCAPGHNQSATPVLTPAVRKAEPEVLDKMQDVFNREMGG